MNNHTRNGDNSTDSEISYDVWAALPAEAEREFILDGQRVTLGNRTAHVTTEPDGTEFAGYATWSVTETDDNGQEITIATDQGEDDAVTAIVAAMTGERAGRCACLASLDPTVMHSFSCPAN